MNDVHTPFPVPEQHLDGCVVIQLPEEIDLANAPGIGNQIIGLLDSGIPGVVVDMTGTSFCDAAGVDAVVRAHHHAQELGAWVRPVVAHPHVRKVFTITKVDQAIRIHPTLDDAFRLVPGDASEAMATEA